MNSSTDGPPARQPAIGISGYASSGKTTAANYIEKRYGYTRLHIAEPLRDMLRPLLRAFRVREGMINRYLTGDLKEQVIPEIGVTSRRLQITLGTEWGRDLIDQRLWARAWGIEADAESAPMNDSVRFPNEESEIHDRDGFTILIARKNCHPVAFKWRGAGRLLYRWFRLMWGVHDSERVDRLHPDHRVTNDGTPEQMYEQIDDIMYRRGIDPLDA